MSKTDRYEFDKLPISEQTKQGMKLSIDDIGIIGRMLSLQDDIHEEESEGVKKALDKVFGIVSELKHEVCSLRGEVKELRGEVGQLRTEVADLRKDLGGVQKSVADTKKDIDKLREEIAKLKRINSWRNILIRIAASIGVGLVVARILHGPL